MAGKEKTYEDLRDLLLLEQFMSSVPQETATFIRERVPKTVDEAGEFAQIYKEAHSHRRPPREHDSPKVENPRRGQDSTNRHTSANEKKCYFCGQPVHRSSTSFRSRRCGGSCCSCSHLKRDCLKFKSDHPRVACAPRAARVDHLRAVCSVLKKKFPASVPREPHGRPAEGIRDSGADMVIVRASSAPARVYTGRTVSVTLAETSFCKDPPVAKISVSTPLLDGDVQAVVMENPPADLILGNSAKMADGTLREVPVYRVPAEVAVVTRAQAARQDRPHTPSTAFRQLPPNSTIFGYATEGALFISAQLSIGAVRALRKVRVLIRLEAT